MQGHSHHKYRRIFNITLVFVMLSVSKATQKITIDTGLDMCLSCYMILKIYNSNTGVGDKTLNHS
jgi:hypothetical protein